MDWPRVVAGIFAVSFAAALLALPTLRVAQGRLAPSAAAGLWISGVSFALIAFALFALDGDVFLLAVCIGIAGAGVGNVVQRRNAS